MVDLRNRLQILYRLTIGSTSARNAEYEWNMIREFAGIATTEPMVIRQLIIKGTGTLTRRRQLRMMGGHLNRPNLNHRKTQGRMPPSSHVNQGGNEMDTILSSANVLMIYALGIITTVMLTNDKVRQNFKRLDEKAYAYIAFGVVTFLATLTLSYWGLIVTVTAMLAYQLFGKKKFSIPGLSEDPNAGKFSTIDQILVHFIDQRDDEGGANKRVIVEAVEAHPELLTVFEPKPTAESYVTAALVRLLAVGTVEGDENGNYFASDQKITAIRENLTEPEQTIPVIVAVNDEQGEGGAAAGGPGADDKQVAASGSADVT
jgi:hypothetical protein